MSPPGHRAFESGDQRSRVLEAMHAHDGDAHRSRHSYDDASPEPTPLAPPSAAPPPSAPSPSDLWIGEMVSPPTSSRLSSRLSSLLASGPASFSSTARSHAPPLPATRTTSHAHPIEDDAPASLWGQVPSKHSQSDPESPGALRPASGLHASASALLQGRAAVQGQEGLDAWASASVGVGVGLGGAVGRRRRGAYC